MAPLALTDWLQKHWPLVEKMLPALLWLVIAAAVAFAVGLLLRYRRAKIQRRYQDHLESQRCSELQSDVYRRDAE